MDVEHREMTGASLHPSKVVTFTGNPASYTPTQSGILVECLTAPWVGYYTTTGTTLGAVRAAGVATAGTAATIAVGDITPGEVVITNAGTSSAAIFDFDFSGLPSGGGGAAVPLIASPPSAPPDPLPATGTAALALETSTPPTLWAYDGTGWSFVAMTAQGGGGTGYDAYAARLTGTYSAPELAAIEALLDSLAGRTIAAGGSQLDSLQLLTLRFMDNAVDSRLNLRGTDYTLDDTNAGAFTVREGVATDGSSQTFSTNFIPSAVGSSFDGVFGFYTRNATGAGYAGGEINFSFFGTYIYASAASYSGAFCSDLITTLTPSPANQQGAATVTRTGLSVVLAKNQQSEVASLADESTSASPTNALILGDTSVGGSAGSTGEPFQNEFGAVWAGVGKGWTEAETLAFHADLETCADVFGAGVIS